MELLISDAALTFSQAIMDMIGRSPQLGSPGRHGARTELLKGLLDAAAVGHLRGHYAPMRSSDDAMSRCMRRIEDERDLTSAGLIDGAGNDGNAAAAAPPAQGGAPPPDLAGWGPRCSCRGILEGLLYTAIFTLLYFGQSQLPPIPEKDEAVTIEDHRA